PTLYDQISFQHVAGDGMHAVRYVHGALAVGGCFDDREPHDVEEPALIGGQFPCANPCTCLCSCSNRHHDRSLRTCLRPVWYSYAFKGERDLFPLLRVVCLHHCGGAEHGSFDNVDRGVDCSEQSTVTTHAVAVMWNMMQQQDRRIGALLD